MLNFLERELSWQQNGQNDPDRIASLDGGGFMELQEEIRGESFIIG